MADQESEQDQEVTLRGSPSSLGSGDPDNTDMYEVICCKCGDDPALSYREASAGLRRIRGPYPLRSAPRCFSSTLSSTTQPRRRRHSTRPGLTSPRQRQDEQIN